MALIDIFISYSSKCSNHTIIPKLTTQLMGSSMQISLSSLADLSRPQGYNFGLNCDKSGVKVLSYLRSCICSTSTSSSSIVCTISSSCRKPPYSVIHCVVHRYFPIFTIVGPNPNPRKHPVKIPNSEYCGLPSFSGQIVTDLG